MTRVAWPTRRTRPHPEPAAAPTRACLAPVTALHLDPRGWVQTCVGSSLLLGNVAEQRMEEIWGSAALARQRAAVAAGDYSAGCGVCGPPWPGADPVRGLARLYDEAVPQPGLHRPREVDLSLGSTCNLRCVMCNGELSSSIRTQREGRDPLPDPYTDEVLEDLVAFLVGVDRLKFLGGEPFLVRAHHAVWDGLHERGVHPECHVTTNGTVWTPRVERVLERFPVSVAVSMDGIRPATVEATRVGARIGTILRNLDRFAAYTRERGTDLSITFCLTTRSWPELAEFLLFADDRDIAGFVNLARSPLELALDRLPAEELGAVVEGLEAQDREVGPLLGRNRPVWDAQLAQLRGLWDVPRPPVPATAVTSPVARSSGRRDPGSPWWPEGLVAELEAWAEGGPVLEAIVDRAGRVEATARWADDLVAPAAAEGRSEMDVVADVLAGLGRPGPPADLGKWADAVQLLVAVDGPGPEATEVRLVRTPGRVPGSGRGPSGLLVAVRAPAGRPPAP